jgi:uncharacterized protein YfaQ (DUF2300 family)
VQAERTALANQAIEQQRTFLGNAIVFDEEFLEFIDDEDDSRTGGMAGWNANQSRVSICRDFCLALLAALAVEVLAIFRVS